MKHYFAPLEGITGLSYRKMHHKYFGGIDKYFMPFLSPTQNHSLTRKDQRELPPAQQESYMAVPQILTKSVEDFLWASNCCLEQGYKEVNLNIGCPSGTVFAKGKGAGMLSSLEDLDAFLQQIFTHCPLKISVKTRIGVLSPEEFPEILEVLNAYPIEELTIHPRVRKAFYQGSVDLECFAYAAEHTKHKLCYNGDICSSEDLAYIQSRFPELSAVMIGRGLIADPGMLCGGTQRSKLLAFHDELLEEYCSLFGSKQNAMARMKEIWTMLICLFDEAEKQGKELRKCKDYDSFYQIAHTVLTQFPLRNKAAPYWQERRLGL